MKNIKLQNPVELKAKGELNSKHCKPVLCIETGTIYTSATDAANAMGVNPSAISLVCIGKVKTCKGNHFCYLSKITENISAIAVQLQEVESLRADANAYRQQQAEAEEARKAEEKRLEEERKEEEKKQKEIVKLDVAIGNLDVMIQREEDKLANLYATRAEKERRKAELQGNQLHQINANATNEEEMWTA